MATLYQNLQSLVDRQTHIHFDLAQFVQEHITRSWWLTAWLAILTYITIRYTVGQMAAAPVSTGLVLVIWLLTLAWTLINEVTRHHNGTTLWLKNNLYSSITNAQLTLILVLFILALLRGFIAYALVNASFSTDPALAAAAAERGGARWGAVVANFRNLMLFRFPRAETWRVWAAIGVLVALFIPSLAVYRGTRYRRTLTRRVLTTLWILSPVIIFTLLRGIGAGEPLPRLNPDIAWGGLLLTIIIAVFGIVASFPLGLLLALGRRSQIRGVPAWLTYGLAIAAMFWFLLTSTPNNLAAARNGTERLLAYWPLLLPVIAFLFQRYFRGNVVALFSTLYIECVRGVPLITVLFMSIILFPLFLPPGVEILNTWRVLAAFALFSAAYLAENVRGGLQAIPKGQYEAADSLGLSTYHKYRLIILPQALRAVIPAIVGQFIGLFKDTSLIAIVGLTEMLSVANNITAQPNWLGVRREPYIFIAIIYFIGSYVMASYSRRLEARLGVGQR